MGCLVMHEDCPSHERSSHQHRTQPPWRQNDTHTAVGCSVYGSPTATWDNLNKTTKNDKREKQFINLHKQYINVLYEHPIYKCTVRIGLLSTEVQNNFLFTAAYTHLCKFGKVSIISLNAQFCAKGSRTDRESEGKAIARVTVV